MSLRKQWNPYRSVCLVGIALIVAGSTMVLSSTIGYAIAQKANPAFYFIRRIVWLFIGFLGIYAIGKVKLRKIEYYALSFFLFSIVLLLIPIIQGGLRWIKIGIFSFQPSELIKISFVIYLADFLKRKGKNINDPKILAVPVGFLVLIGVLLQFQKDLGTLLVFFIVLMLMLFLAGIKKRFIYWLTGTGVILLIGLILIFPYRIERIKTFWESFSNSSAVENRGGYQTYQAKIALGSGGVFGKGIGKSSQKLKFIPKAHKDYVFAIVGEEVGFLGSIVVLWLFGWLVYLGFRMALETDDPFQSFLSAGISGLFGFQFLLHVFVVLNLVPAKGTTLPFFSVGGSALLANLFALGLLLQVAKNLGVKRIIQLDNLV